MGFVACRVTSAASFTTLGGAMAALRQLADHNHEVAGLNPAALINV